MSSGSLISVIVPCYNSERYIEKMIECLLSQTYTNYEVIFVDDGSSDSTVEIIKRYLNKDGIYLLQQSNQYAGVARNNGLKKANGKYVMFLDSDDFFDVTFLEKMINSIEKYNSDVAICNIKYIDAQTDELLNIESNVKKSILEPYEEKGVFSYKDIPDDILTIGFSGPYNKIYRREFLLENDIWFQASKRDNDLSFAAAVMAGADCISWTYDALYYYRINNTYSLQGFKDIDMEEILSTVIMSKRELVRLKRYESVKYSFQKQVLSRWHHLLDQQQNIENFCSVYDAIKNQLFGIIDLQLDDQFCFLAYRKDYIHINQMDPYTYLLWKNKELQISRGEKYTFPFLTLGNKYKNIAIYGYGNIGRAYVKQLANNNKYKISVIFDKNYKNIVGQNDIVIASPDDVDKYNYDVIVIAVEDVKVVKNIMFFLESKNIKSDRTIWDV